MNRVREEPPSVRTNPIRSVLDLPREPNTLNQVGNLSKEIAMAKEKWYRAGLSFGCVQCGNCCSGAPGNVWVTKEEIRRIARFLEQPDEWLGKRHIRRVGLRYSLTEKPNGDCIFLERESGEGRCSIYPVRPLQCRTWPFWTQSLRSPDAWNEAHAKCLGINRGRHYGFDEIEGLRTKKSW